MWFGHITLLPQFASPQTVIQAQIGYRVSGTAVIASAAENLVVDRHRRWVTVGTGRDVSELTMCLWDTGWHAQGRRHWMEFNCVLWWNQLAIDLKYFCPSQQATCEWLVAMCTTYHVWMSLLCLVTYNEEIWQGVLLQCEFFYVAEVNILQMWLFCRRCTQLHKRKTLTHYWNVPSPYSGAARSFATLILLPLPVPNWKIFPTPKRKTNEKTKKILLPPSAPSHPHSLRHWFYNKGNMSKQVEEVAGLNINERIINHRKR